MFSRQRKTRHCSKNSCGNHINQWQDLVVGEFPLTNGIEQIPQGLYTCQNHHLLVLFSMGMIQAQVIFSINPEISQSTWMMPVSVETNLYESVAVKYSGQLFDAEHPKDNYTWYSYLRYSKTYVNTESYVEYNNSVLGVIFGRKYNPVGHGKMSGSFISPTAPSLDQATFSLEDFHGFNYRHSIIRLDNRFKEVDDEKKRGKSLVLFESNWL